MMKRVQGVGIFKPVPVELSLQGAFFPPISSSSFSTSRKPALGLPDSASLCFPVVGLLRRHVVLVSHPDECGDIGMPE